MRITRKYLLGEMTGPFLVGVGSFTVIVLLQRFSRLADLVIAKGCRRPLSGASSSPSSPVLEITLPASLLLAVLLGLGRLAADSETTALSAPGGMRGVALPVLVASAITCAAVLLTGWYGVPWGTRDAAHPCQIVSERAGAGASGHVFREITPMSWCIPTGSPRTGSRCPGSFSPSARSVPIRFSCSRARDISYPPPATGDRPGVVRRNHPRRTDGKTGVPHRLFRPDDVPCPPRGILPFPEGANRKG